MLLKNMHRKHSLFCLIITQARKIILTPEIMVMVNTFENRVTDSQYVIILFS